MFRDWFFLSFMLRLSFLLRLETSGGHAQHAGRVLIGFCARYFFLVTRSDGLMTEIGVLFLLLRSAATGGILCAVFLNTEVIGFHRTPTFLQVRLGFWMTMTFRRSCQWKF